MAGPPPPPPPELRPPRPGQSAATVDHMERLREYAEWGGKDSTYQWALDEIERLREALRISYPATPVDCLLSELRECFDLSADDLISRRQFENHVAEFRKEAVVDAA